MDKEDIKYETAKMESIELSVQSSQHEDLEGGDEASKAAKQELDETTKALMKMPPDWEMAERYGKATQVVDRAAILVTKPG